MFGWFKKKYIPVFDGPKWPQANEASAWMYKRVQYYLNYFPNDAHKLFDPSSGFYMPMCVHIGSWWSQDRQDEYRKVKADYPELVIEAKKAFIQYGRYSQSRIGDLEDFDPGVELLP